MKFLASIIGFISGLFSFFHDRSERQAGADAEVIKEDTTVLKEAENAKDILNDNNLPDELLRDPSERDK